MPFIFCTLNKNDEIKEICQFIQKLTVDFVKKHSQKKELTNEYFCDIIELQRILLSRSKTSVCERGVTDVHIPRRF